MSSAAMSVFTSERQPAKQTFSATPRFCASAFSSSICAPSPAMTRRSCGRFFGGGKAFYERSDILDGVEPRRDTDDDAFFITIEAERTEIAEPVRIFRYDREINAVINGENFCLPETARNQKASSSRPTRRRDSLPF